MIEKTTDRDEDREPAALREFQHVGGQERHVERRKGGEQRDRDRQAPALAAHVQIGQDRRDRHVAADRDAVGRAEIVGRLEDHHDDDDRDQQDVVDPRHIDLADLGLRGVADFEPRQIAELDRLAGIGESAGDHRLRGDDRRQRRQPDKRVKPPFGREQVERIFDRRRVAEQQGALSEIVQHQRRERRATSQARRSAGAPEMPHIGIKRLGPGHREKHRAEHQEPAHRVFDEHRHAVDRVQREQHMRLVQDRPDPERRQDGEPHHHDRAEQPADNGGAAALHQNRPISSTSAIGTT